MTEATLFFDGGSRGNPGAAAGGAVLQIDGETFTDSQFIPHATNNVAEYVGLIVGLQLAISKGVSAIVIYGDSKLVINQVAGLWQCHDPEMARLCEQAQNLLTNFTDWDIDWVKRDRNSKADAVVNACIDDCTGVSKLKQKAETVQAIAPSKKLEKPIKALIAKGDSAKFKDFMALKAGRDEFSAKKLPALKELVNPEAQSLIADAWGDITDADLAKVYRWYLRGLPVDLAIRKVKTDLEVGQNAFKGKQYKDPDMYMDYLQDA